MALSSIVYGAMGLSLALFSNAARKQPLMRRPWEHVFAAGLGVYLGSCMERAQIVMKERLDDARADKAAEQAAREAKFAAYHAGQKAESTS